MTKNLYSKQKNRRIFVIKRVHSGIIVITAYSLSVLLANYFFTELQYYNGIVDNEEVSLAVKIFVGTMLLFMCWSLFNIFRNPRLFND